MNNFNQVVLKLGAVKAIALITIFSILLSVVFAYVFIVLSFGLNQEVLDAMPSYLLISALIPALVAPIVATGLTQLLFKVDALEKETRYLATYDALTGLYTRRAFYEHAEQQLKDASKESKQVAMLVADLDGFKKINDTFGHHAGDLALKHVSEIIKKTIRDTDIAGRVGGDEFIFCLPNVTDVEANAFGKRLVSNLNDATFSYEENDIQLSMSVGLMSSKLNSGGQIDLLIKQADDAMYRAKQSGKNQLAS